MGQNTNNQTKNNQTKNEPTATDSQPAAGDSGAQPGAVVETAKPRDKVMIRAIHGTMIHPYVPMDIRPDAITQVDEIDSWLQSQIDAKKIEVV